MWMPSRSLQQNKRHDVRCHSDVDVKKPANISAWDLGDHARHFGPVRCPQQLGPGHTNTPHRSDQPTGGRESSASSFPLSTPLGLPQNCWNSTVCLRCARRAHARRVPRRFGCRIWKMRALLLDVWGCEEYFSDSHRKSANQQCARNGHVPTHRKINPKCGDSRVWWKHFWWRLVMF